MNSYNCDRSCQIPNFNSPPNIAPPPPPPPDVILEEEFIDCKGKWINELLHFWKVYRKYASICDLYQFCDKLGETETTPDEIRDRILKPELLVKERIFIIQQILECSIGDAFIIKNVLSSSVFMSQKFADTGINIREKCVKEPVENYNGIGYTRYVRPHKLTKDGYSASQIALATAGPNKSISIEQGMHGSISLIAALLLPLTWKPGFLVVDALTDTGIAIVSQVIGIINSLLFIYAIILSTSMIVFSSVFGLSEPGIAHYFSIHAIIRYSPILAIMTSLLLLFPIEMTIRFWDGETDRKSVV